MDEDEVNEVEERIRLFYPLVDESQKPHIGMSFNSVKECESFYKDYAKLSGFGSRKHTTKFRPNTRELYARECVCSKQGGKDDSKEKDASKERIPMRQEHGEKKKKRNRASTRTFCPAFIRFQIDKRSSDWKIVKFVEGHNHVLFSPSKAHLMTQHREVTDVHKSLLNQFSEANVGTAQAFNVLSLQSGGIEHIGCTQRDIRNYETSVRKERKEYDAQLLVDYFQEMQEFNPSFYYAVDVDDEKKLKHCFWADGSARKAYAHFGDVVVFDTTSDTNQYHLIFAPFTGINHHRQSIGFGWALLKDEKIESFLWLFEKFLDAMSGQPPRVMITDQDPAMRNAIAQSFPRTFHRLCMWHILQKLPDKIRPQGDGFGDFCTRLSNCAKYSEMPEQFENEWEQVIRHFKLEDKKWLQDIFSIRERWIPAYSKEIFMARARTTQRSESINSFFDKYVSKKNTLMDFIVRFQLAIKRQRHNEIKANFDDLNSRPKMMDVWDVEKQMVEIYTRANFVLFQDELRGSAHYGAGFRQRDGDLETYEVRKIANSTSTNKRKVVYDMSSKMLSCDCMKFESEGIPCKHILTTMRCVFLNELPDKLILKGWTKAAIESIVHDKNGVELHHDPRDRELKAGKEVLATMVGGFVKKASMSKKRLELANEMFSEFIDNFNLKCEELGEHLSNDSNIGVSATLPLQIDVHPPEMSKTKGSGKRLKGWREKITDESKRPKRLCRGCNKPTNHDKRNCPNLKSGVASSTTPMFDKDDPSCDSDSPTIEEDEINLTYPFVASSLSQL